MHHRRLRWHSRRRQEALLTRLDNELNRWLDAWSVEPACLSLQPMAADAYKPATPITWLRFNASNGVMYFGAPASHIEGLGGLLAKASNDDILHLGRRVGDRALKALASQWLDAGVPDLEVEEISAPSKEIFDSRFGAAFFSLKGSGFQAYVVFDSEVVDKLVPITVGNLEPLSARDSQLGNEKIELNVMLDLGAATLADTLGLRIGDVLLSGTSINSTFQLIHPDMRRLADVRLARKGMLRAIQVDTP